MTAFISLLAIVVLGALVFWLVGSIALRVLGGLTVLAALFVIARGESVAAGLLVLAIGLLAWLAGHWLYAYRHHAYANRLVERIYLQLLPRKLDPTRGWGYPVHVQNAPPPPDQAAARLDSQRTTQPGGN